MSLTTKALRLARTGAANLSRNTKAIGHATARGAKRINRGASKLKEPAGNFATIGGAALVGNELAGALKKEASLMSFLKRDTNAWDALAQQEGFSSGQDLLNHATARSMLEPEPIVPVLEKFDENQVRMLGYAAGEMAGEPEASSLATEAYLLHKKKQVDDRNRIRQEQAAKKNEANKQELRLVYANEPEFRKEVDQFEQKRTKAKSLVAQPVSFSAKYRQENSKARPDFGYLDAIARDHGFSDATEATDLSGQSRKMTFGGLRTSAVSHNQLVDTAKELMTKQANTIGGVLVTPFQENRKLSRKIGLKAAVREKIHPVKNGVVKEAGLIGKLISNPAKRRVAAIKAFDGINRTANTALVGGAGYLGLKMNKGAGLGSVVKAGLAGSAAGAYAANQQNKLKNQPKRQVIRPIQRTPGIYPNAPR